MCGLYLQFGLQLRSRRHKSLAVGSERRAQQQRMLHCLPSCIPVSLCKLVLSLFKCFYIIVSLICCRVDSITQRRCGICLGVQHVIEAVSLKRDDTMKVNEACMAHPLPKSVHHYLSCSQTSLSTLVISMANTEASIWFEIWGSWIWVNKISVFPGKFFKFSKNFDFFQAIFKEIYHFPCKNSSFTATSGQIILFLFKSHHFRTYFRYMI